MDQHRGIQLMPLFTPPFPARRNTPHASQLLLPPRFSDAQLAAALVGLSYGGDVRMGLAGAGERSERGGRCRCGVKKICRGALNLRAHSSHHALLPSVCASFPFSIAITLRRGPAQGGVL